jgi:hypothetical protein
MTKNAISIYNPDGTIQKVTQTKEGVRVVQ